MNNSRRTQASKLAVLTAMIVVAVSAAAPVGASASSADFPQASAAACVTKDGIQSIAKRHGISCAYAQRVHAKCRYSCLKGLSECRASGKQRVRWNGWTIRANGRRSGTTSHLWRKGSLSFVTQGGGSC